jgi:hypothetical protein
MAVSIPRTWVTGDLISIANMNSYVRDNIKGLYNAPRCAWKHATAGANSGATGVPFRPAYDTELWDTDGMLDVAVSTNNMYVNTAGLYVFGAWWFWASSAAGRRLGRCYMNTNNGLWDNLCGLDENIPDATANQAINCVWGSYYGSVGDYMFTYAYQTSGGTLAFGSQPIAWAVWVGL